MIKRGDIFYVMPHPVVGSENACGRPAVVVSNDKCNAFSPVIEVVFMTTAPKNDLPTHVTIRSTDKESTALCEQVTSVSVERLGDLMGHCSKNEMTNIDIALLISLDLDVGNVKEKVVEKVVTKNIPVKGDPDDQKEIARLQTESKAYSERLNIALVENAQLKARSAEAKCYKEMYGELLERLIVMASANKAPAVESTRTIASYLEAKQP